MSEKCDLCGRFISYADFESGEAVYEVWDSSDAYGWQTESGRIEHKECNEKATQNISEDSQA